MLQFYERAVARLDGLVLLRHPDVVTNPDPLAGPRLEKTLYATRVDTSAKVDVLLAWFVANT